MEVLGPALSTPWPQCPVHSVRGFSITTQVKVFREITPEGELRLNFHPGQAEVWLADGYPDTTVRITCLQCGKQWGKALDIETPIPTPYGFKPMGSLGVGDKVFDEQGQICTVTFSTDIMRNRPCYRVEFDDGDSLVADAEHLWTVQTSKQRKNQARWRGQRRFGEHESLITTVAMRRSLKDGQGANNYSIPLTKAVQYPHRDLPIPPYTLGAWLGDGLSRGARIFSADVEVLEAIRDEGVMVGVGRVQSPSNQSLEYQIGRATKGGNDNRNPVLDGLRELKLIHNKHIPDIYQTASIDQRMALAQGLMDTDGYCQQAHCEFSTIRKALAEGMVTLLASLGIKSRIKEKTATINGKDCGLAYRVMFTTDIPIFGLKRKSERQIGGHRPNTKKRYITNIIPLLSRPVKCIQVDSPSNLYLAGHGYIPTHNTCLGPHWLDREMDRHGPGDYGAITATYPLLTEKMLPELQEVFVRLFKKFTYRAGDHIFESIEKLRGAPAYRIMVKSAHNPESLASGTWKAAWCDEVGQSQFPRQSWEEINARVAINEGPIFCSTTVYEFGWYKYEIYDRWVDGNPTIAIVQGDSTDNPIFSQAEYERQRGLLPPWKFDMAFRGRFTNPAGLIYDSFDSDICLIPRFEIPSEWPRYVGHDFGPNNTAAIWYASDPATGYLYAYREYLAGELEYHGHVQKWKALSTGENILNRVGGARVETGQREACTTAGWPVGEPREFGVEAGINIVYGWHRTNKLFVFRDLDKYIAEKTSYTRELGDDYIPTEKIENKSKFHLMDAERYILSHMGPERTNTSDKVPVYYHNEQEGSGSLKLQRKLGRNPERKFWPEIRNRDLDI